MDERLEDTLATYESVADRYAQLHDDRTAVAEIVEGFIDAVEGDRVLDVGCGPGWETATFENRGLDAVALDLSPSFLAEARERALQSALFRADMRSLPLEPDLFDGLWACASLLHVPPEDVPDMLAEFRRVLVDDGVFAASMKRATQSDSPDSPYENDERHFERYTPAELRSLLADAGFEVVGGDDSGQWVFLTARA